MTIKSTGSLSFLNDIESEFGDTSTRSLGSYRSSDSNFQNKNVGTLSNLPLDDGIPTSGEIKFSDFYGKKLNMVVDYYSGGTEIKRDLGATTMNARNRYNNQPSKVTVVGGFRARPALNAWQGGKRVIVNVNKKIGGNNDGNISDVALRTGDWPGGTELQVEIGANGKILGAGGDGGNPSTYIHSPPTPGFPGGNGTSALGVEYPAVINNNGVLRCGFGGGGGGSGGAIDPNSSPTDYGRTGSGGGGGAGLPAGVGGSKSGQSWRTGSFHPGGDEDTPTGQSYNGKAGENGTEDTGGSGGDVFPYDPGGSVFVRGGKGGNGGDEVDPPQSGGTAEQSHPTSSYAAAKPGGAAGNNGKSIYYTNSSVQAGSTLIGSESGGIGVGAID
tara:strand:+ start:926 stop:2083 length:1158 start_codon:yes stop_codon:yes gene_type:complete